MTGTFIALLAATIPAAIPIIYVALGELVAERSGVLNLSVEGAMLAGALSAFAIAYDQGNFALAFLAGGCAGALVALLFAWLALGLHVNQVAAGLSVGLFAIGLAGFLGRPYVSLGITGLRPMDLGFVSDIPVLGPILFRQDVLVLPALAACIGIWFFLYRTRPGLALRAVGDAPDSAFALGYPVTAIRCAAVTFGGVMAGFGGAYMALVYTPIWVEGMTSGRGWIALALVVFGAWRPFRIVFGAFLFSGVTLFQFLAQGSGIVLPPQFFSSLPYLVAIVVLALISRDVSMLRRHAPAALGKTFIPRN